MLEQIKSILAEHAQVSIDTIEEDTDLYLAGMTSIASVNVMLALEEAFDIEFPDRLLKRSVFESIASIRDAVESLKVEA